MKKDKIPDLGLVDHLAGLLRHDSTVLLPIEVNGQYLRTGQVYTLYDGQYKARIGYPTKKGIYAYITQNDP